MDSKFIQSYTYAKIKPYRNYSNLDKKVAIYTSDETTSPPKFMDDDSDPFDDAPQQVRKLYFSGEVKDDVCNYILNLNLYPKSNANFFHTTTPTSSFRHHGKKGTPEVKIEPIKLVSAKTVRSGEKEFFETSKDRQIRKHYNNPFSCIEIFTISRSIIRVGDKITIKNFRQTKTRKINAKFFTKVQNSTTVVFDMVKGNFTIVKYVKGRKKKPRKNFYSNSFLSLENALPEVFKISDCSLARRSKLTDEFFDAFKDDEFKNAVREFFMGEDGKLGYDSYLKDFMHYWMPRFVQLKQIKIPDEGDKLLKHYYPTERYLKKNDRKLVASILDRLGIKTKVTIKILHQYPNLDLMELSRLCQLLGEDYSRYLGNLNSKFYPMLGESVWGKQTGGFRTLLQQLDIRFRFDMITKSERENIVHILNDLSTHVDKNVISGIVGQFIDHFGMIERLRRYYPDLALNVKKWRSFTDEHSRLSSLERSIRKGYSTHLLFEHAVKQEIEMPFETFESDEQPIQYLPDPEDRRAYERMYANFTPSYMRYIFTPKLLCTSEDYDDEGAVMHHCVASYIEHSNTIIVSLRCGDERVTCEYNTGDRKRVQARYIQNGSPPKHFGRALIELDKRIRGIPFSVKPIDKRRVPLKLNGISVAQAHLESDTEIPGFMDMVRHIAPDVAGPPVIDMNHEDRDVMVRVRDGNPPRIVNMERTIDLGLGDLA